MIAVVVRQAGGLGSAEAVVIGLAIIAVCAAFALAYLYPPWSRRFPTPRRQIHDMRDHRRMARMKRHHARDLADYPLPPPPVPEQGQEGDA